MTKRIRVRFAPSPTGGLHLGGVRTVLYNYLFAKNQQGDFIVRIEDTDQTRFVPGAEDYIFNCLKWAGMEPDESPLHGGPYGPYRQSERKAIYRSYAEQLIKDGNAYYAFDTPEELEKMRNDYKTDSNPSPQYDHTLRNKMRNSLTLPDAEVQHLLKQGTKHVIRIHVKPGETVSLTDMIRGEVHFDTSVVDDKVLLKADGMPTYHLAVVVDDYLMRITHAFRGEEWLSSTPVHILLWKYLGWEKDMPQWAHLPLILGPNGKLSKRDGAKYGFPVFAMNWNDPKSGEFTEGFKEKGFLPDAFINLLALLGWNDGTEQEVFSKDELIHKFSMDRVHSGGAKFDYEKAKWFNHEWIKRSDAKSLLQYVSPILEEKGITITDQSFLEKVIGLIKDRCTLLPDFYDQCYFIFKAPETIDTVSILPKWNESKRNFFTELIAAFSNLEPWNAASTENFLKQMAAASQIKPGELMMPFRIMLVGGKFGPGVFEIAELLGKKDTIARMEKTLSLLP
jgi:glutamyl-tRNA synthetase